MEFCGYVHICHFLRSPIGSSYAVAAYVSSYVSKVDKFVNTSWRDIVREIDYELRQLVESKAGVYYHTVCCI